MRLTKSDYRRRVLEADITPNAKLVCFALLEYQNAKTGQCYPSGDTLALATGLCRNSVTAAVKLCVAVGLFHVKKVRPKGAKFSVNSYSFPFDCAPDEQSNEQSNDMSIEQSNDCAPDGHKPIKPLEPFKPIERIIEDDHSPAGIEADIGNSLQDDEPVAAKPEKPAAEPEQKAYIPDWLDKATWLAFRQHRKKIKKTLTPHGESLMFADLLDWKEKGHDPVAIINNSIKNGWIGLFAPKEPPKPSYRDYEPPKRADGYSACSARHERRN